MLDQNTISKEGYVQILITLDFEEESPLHVQIYDQICSLIDGDQIRSGAQLPSTRELSEQLNVSRNTIVSAYEDLHAEGYITSIPAVGTFICTHAPKNCLDSDIKKESTVVQDSHLKVKEYNSTFVGLNFNGLHLQNNKLLCDFNPASINHELFPLRHWRRLTIERLLSGRKDICRYGDSAGLLELRSAIANNLGPTRGMNVSPEQVIIVGGCQQGLNYLSDMYVKNGDNVVVEAPCYRGAYYIFKSYGANLIPVTVDINGITTDRLPEDDVQFIYLTPSHQSPLGVTLSHERRLTIVRWASRVGAFIIEVDYDSDYRYKSSPQKSLYALSGSENVIYMSSFSKTLGPGVSIGYMVFPRKIAEYAKKMKSYYDLGQSWLEQAVLADFINQGHYAHLVKRIRQSNYELRNCLLDALHKHFGESVIYGAGCGMHISWQLPGGNKVTASKLQEELLKVGVAIYTLKTTPVDECRLFPKNNYTVFLGYAHLSKDLINQGVAKIAEAIKQIQLE